MGVIGVPLTYDKWFKMPHQCLRGYDALSSCLLLQKKSVVCLLPFVVYLWLWMGVKSWSSGSGHGVRLMQKHARAARSDGGAGHWRVHPPHKGAQCYQGPIWIHHFNTGDRCLNDSNLNIDHYFLLSPRLGSVQICCSGTSSEKRSFQMRQTLLSGDPSSTLKSPLCISFY